MAPPRLAEKENALRRAGAHGKASVPERQGVPGSSSMSGIRRPNYTGLERTCRMAARLAAWTETSAAKDIPRTPTVSA
jgi:hypothetical protein